MGKLESPETNPDAPTAKNPATVTEMPAPTVTGYLINEALMRELLNVLQDELPMRTARRVVQALEGSPLIEVPKKR